MKEEGFRFFDHVKVIGLHESGSYRGTYEDRETGKKHPYYVFNLGVGGFIINGCTYNPVRRSVMMPSRGETLNTGTYKRQRAVKMFGPTAARIREMLDSEISSLKQRQKEDQFAA
jgi:hypothetical protein